MKISERGDTAPGNAGDESASERHSRDDTFYLYRKRTRRGKRKNNEKIRARTYIYTLLLLLLLYPKPKTTNHNNDVPISGYGTCIYIYKHAE